MRPFLARVFAFTNFAMASLPTSSYPSRRLAHITRHLNSAASCSGELTSVGAPAAAADAVPARRNPASSKVHAAVLVCLFEDPHSGLRVLLTKRASSLNSHSGEVSLPGGKVEEGDADVKATALREAEEEIGLDPALVSIVTVLEPFLSKNGLNVVPVIGMVSDKALFKPVLNKAEVEDIFDAPLEMFLKMVSVRTLIRLVLKSIASTGRPPENKGNELDGRGHPRPVFRLRGGGQKVCDLGLNRTHFDPCRSSHFSEATAIC
ncbi:nudix hydrolase 11-like isoform X2 [Phragmites australis]|uniref:nudix hydrolase 11-like isoform X2 n=1 Tax=Phragmites australis TaxID=29695 RepID=UPI002D7655FA|nr:nudix hydrolase 11-like isoform X2 [Phragmites australis]